MHGISKEHLLKILWNLLLNPLLADRRWPEHKLLCKLRQQIVISATTELCHQLFISATTELCQNPSISATTELCYTKFIISATTELCWASICSEQRSSAQILTSSSSWNATSPQQRRHVIWWGFSTRGHIHKCTRSQLQRRISAEKWRRNSWWSIVASRLSPSPWKIAITPSTGKFF